MGNLALRALVVEDDSLTRLSLVAALEKSGINVVAHSGTAGEALAEASKLKPNLALLDLHLGAGPTGIDVARALRRTDPSIGVVFLTSYDDPRLLTPSLPPLPAGSQYLTKRSVSDLAVLLQAINNAMSTKRSASQQHIPAFGHLSDVQIETLRLVAQGLSNTEIAKRRFVKPKSVELTISRVAKALGIVSDTSQNQRVHIAKVYFRAVGNELAEPLDSEHAI
jgi:two-component system, NarL family, nitrate/nitrite response regulator NarL